MATVAEPGPCPLPPAAGGRYGTSLAESCRSRPLMASESSCDATVPPRPGWRESPFACGASLESASGLPRPPRPTGVARLRRVLDGPSGVIPGHPVLDRLRPEPPRRVRVAHVGPRQGVLAGVLAAPDGAAVGVSGRPHGVHHAHVGVPVGVAEPGHRLAAGGLEHGAAVLKFRGQRRAAGTGQGYVAEP